MRIVLDTTILVRANEHTQGLARELLVSIVEGNHILVLSNEILSELARVLRYPRLQAFYKLTEELVYDYIAFLRSSSEIVNLNPLLLAPVRDPADQIVVQTAIIGEAEILCSTDEDFFEEPTTDYLRKFGIGVMDDIELMQRLRHGVS